MTKQRTFTGIEARRLLRRARTATLATLNRDGGIPYASLVNVATDLEGQPVILISALAWHTKNLLADSRASLLVAEPPAAGDALTGPRATIMGRLVRSDSPQARRRYLARHPAAAMYADFTDFGFWQLEPELIHAVAGFGRIETLEVNEVFPSLPGWAGLEESAIAHMNEDHADALRTMAVSLLQAPEGEWKINALDADGASLTDGRDVLRLEFTAPLLTAGELRVGLARLTRLARGEQE